VRVRDDADDGDDDGDGEDEEREGRRADNEARVRTNRTPRARVGGRQRGKR